MNWIQLRSKIKSLISSGHSNSFDYTQNIANIILQELNIMNEHYMCNIWEIPIQDICLRLGIQIIEVYNMKNHLSILDVRKDPIIYIPFDLSINDKRVEIARQFGHLMMHPLDRVYHGRNVPWIYSSDNSEYKLSQMAQLFAMHILVPRMCLGVWLSSFPSRSIIKKIIDWIFDNPIPKQPTYSEASNLFGTPEYFIKFQRMSL